MAKGNVQLGLDASQMSGITGFIDGLAKEVQTDKLISSVVGYVQSELSKEFGYAVDAAARAAPESFLHVYEWGNSYQDYSTVGSPVHRLWQLNQIGRGRSRAMSFVFLPSVRPVPINPILEGLVREGVHVFTWKAPIMEYGMRVSVKRKPGTKVLIFTDNATDEVVFSKGPHSFNAGTSPHGKPGQRRVFTSFFVAWWATEAGNIFENRLRSQIENDIAVPRRWDRFVRRYKPKKKQFTIQTTLQGHSNFNQARRDARAEIRAMGRDYQNKTRQGRLEQYGF